MTVLLNWGVPEMEVSGDRFWPGKGQCEGDCGVRERGRGSGLPLGPEATMAAPGEIAPNTINPGLFPVLRKRGRAPQVQRKSPHPDH
jgi:hypothetical protein